MKGSGPLTRIGILIMLDKGHPLPNTKPVLFIDDDEPQPLKRDTLLDERMGSHHKW
jgi:hypothetical protein